LDPDKDPTVRGTDPEIRIRIRTKMSRIPNTVKKKRRCSTDKTRESAVRAQTNVSSYCVLWRNRVKAQYLAPPWHPYLPWRDIYAWRGRTHIRVEAWHLIQEMHGIYTSERRGISTWRGSGI
jgi:hypothetical protein